VRCATGNFCEDARGLAIASQTETKTRATEQVEHRGSTSTNFRVLERVSTYFHFAQSWGVNESTAYRIVRKIENRLSQSRAFSLPGKKQLQGSESDLKVVVVDVTESPIERPKKTKALLQ
jgi:hypothetical protein